MRVFNKKNSCIFVVLFILNISFYNMIAFAETSKTVGVTSKFSSTSVYAGGTFVQSIGLENFSGVVKGIQAAKFVIDYDSSKFSCDVLTVSKQINANELFVIKSENKVVIIYLDSSKANSPITEGGAIIDVKFTANSNIAIAAYDFVLSSGSTSAFVDCDDSSPTGQMDVKPIFNNSVRKINILSKKYSVNAVSSKSTSARTADFTFMPDKSILQSGDILNISISSSNWVNVVNGVVALNIKLGFDGNVFEFQSGNVTAESKIQMDKDTMDFVVANPNALSILYMDNSFESPIPAEGVIFNITFKVKGTTSGSYDFTLYGDKGMVDGQTSGGINSIIINYPAKKTVLVDATIVSAPSSGQISSASVSANQVGISEDTKKVISAIDSLPENLTNNDKAVVSKALEEYNKLPDTEKAKVVNYDKLESAVSTINNLPSDMKSPIRLDIIIIVAVVILIILAIILTLRLRKRKPE